VIHAGIIFPHNALAYPFSLLSCVHDIRFQLIPTKEVGDEEENTS